MAYGVGMLAGNLNPRQHLTSIRDDSFNGVLTMGPIIRSEMLSDHEAIDNILKLAFGGKAEGLLVRRLRDRSDFDVDLSLIAELDGQAVGHILFSPVWLEMPTISVTLSSLAPLAVLPEHQRQGIGSALVHAGLKACQVKGFCAVVVLGHPNFYPRFGFKPVRQWNIDLPFAAPQEAKLALELTSGSLHGLAGRIHYPPEFEGV